MTSLAERRAPSACFGTSAVLLACVALVASACGCREADSGASAGRAATSSSEGEEPASWKPWPLPEASGGFEILRTDCQLQQGCQGVMLHNGIDLAAAEGTEVRAIEPGTVTWVRRLGVNTDGVMVATEGASETGFLYAHLTDITVDVGTEVETGDLLGVVKQWDSSASCMPHPDHLHLQWIRSESASTDATGRLSWGLLYHSEGNTLALMDPAADVKAPQILPVAEGRPFLVIPEASLEPCEATSGEPDVIVVTAGRVEVVACVEDRLRPDSAWPLAPYSIEVSLREETDGAPLDAGQGFRFDGPLPDRSFDASVIYRRDELAMSVPEGAAARFYFNLGNDDGIPIISAEDAGAALDLSAVEPGYYALRVQATDASGNTTSSSMRIRVVSP